MKTPVYLLRKRTLPLTPPVVSGLAFLLAIKMKIYTEGKEIPQCSGIYALVCPVTGDIRYIGKSKNIRRRYNNHKSASSNKSHPVTRWTAKLRTKGLSPCLSILYEGQEEELDEREIYFIKKYREAGSNLMNLEDGGSTPAASGNGRSLECWSVAGVADPYRILRNITLPIVRYSDRMKHVMKNKSDQYRSLKTEKERVEFQLNCFSILMEGNNKEVEIKAERWMSKASRQINEKYPGRVTLKFACGTIYTP